METRTTIVLDDDLIAKAMSRAGVTTRKAAVEAALRAYVGTPDYSGLLALVGTGVIADNYDPKTLFCAVPVDAQPVPAISNGTTAKARLAPKRRRR